MRNNYTNWKSKLMRSGGRFLSLSLLLAGTMISSLTVAQTVTVGTGTGSNGTTTYPSAYGNWYWGARTQYLYRASELQAAGANAGLISSIAFNVINVNNASNFDGYNIQIKNTTTNDLNAAWETGLTQVVPATNYNITTGWNVHNFSLPFFWDGTSNIVVEVCFNNSSFTQNASTEWTNGLPSGSSRTYRADAAGVCGNPSVTTFINDTDRPNAQFNFLPPFANDAGAGNVFNPKPFQCSTSNEFSMSILNGGSDTLTSATVNWSVNGIAQSPYLWSGSIDPYTLGDSTFIGNYTFMPGDTIQAYTSNPNGVQDSATFNDTLVHIVPDVAMSGIYTVDPIGTGSSNFLSIAEAANAINTRGLCGAVTVNIADGVYNDSLFLENVPGVSSTNTITFQSANGDSSLVMIQSSPVTPSSGVVTLKNVSNFSLKDVTVYNDGSFTDAVVVYLEGDADNLSFERNYFINDVTSPSFLYDEALVYKNGSINNNVLFDECRFEGGEEGLYWFGNASNYDDDLVITNCEFVDQVDAGLYLYYQTNPQVSGNTMHSSANSFFSYGYQLYYCVGNNVNVTNNMLTQPAGSTWPTYGMYMFNVNGDLTRNANISGNVISIPNGDDNAIYVGSGIFVELVNNSVYLGSSNTTGAVEFNGGSANFLRNNAIQASGSATAIEVFGTPIFYSDHNAFGADGDIASWQGAQPSLADLQMETGLDSNSVELSGFMFSDTTSLRSCNDTLDQAGTETALHMMDLQGDPVDQSAVDIGADQFATASTFDWRSPVGLCTGGMVTLEAWYFDTIVWNGTDTGNTYQTSSLGSVVVQGIGLCGTAFDTISVIPAPEVDLPASLVICEDGGSSSIDAGIMNASYLWSTGETTQTIQVSSPGNYAVTVTDQDGCISDDQLTADFNVPVDLADEEIMCDGGAITIDAGIAGGTYNWSTGETTQSTNVSAPGVVSVTVTDADGCVSSDDVDVIDVPFPTADFTSVSLAYTASFTNTSTGGDSYFWDFGDGSTSTDFSPTHLYNWTTDSAVAFTVQLAVANACGSDTITYEVFIGAEVGYEELANGASYSIYPNPANNVVNISLNEVTSSEITYELIDLQGKIVLQNNIGVINGVHNEQLNVDRLTPGVYFLRLQVGNDVGMSQIVVQ